MPAAGGKQPYRERAQPAGRALFCCLALLATAPPVIAASDCPTQRIDQRAPVRYVIDGDTLILGDGRHLRLIGINTPELGRDGAADEAGARAARDRLRRLISSNGRRIGLRLGHEARDRHGRLLAHAFLADGRNLTARLLAEGAGFHISIPPNLWQHDCYASLARSAREAGRGVWGEPAWRPIPSRDLTAATRGYRRLRGRVSRIGDSHSARWINLEGGLALRIPRDALEHFRGIRFETLPGRTIEVQGWVYPRRGQPRMTLHHPDALRILSSDD
ncbi:thermonuclease family protein [Thiohalobacter sp. IOR34]|uniref:thermonuclease family protein n=1 Tax=Thiohalobacter sp. IOR34 TaxID=3057176 RepID=UPI0025AFC974|nr:thermonuclease family protein [Thiohalobacter sp. IOR34]WJW75694.1 thermonuclease family protein [Thiohalobacter sp. IOR34]